MYNSIEKVIVQYIDLKKINSVIMVKISVLRFLKLNELFSMHHVCAQEREMTQPIFTLFGINKQINLTILY